MIIEQSNVYEELDSKSRQNLKQFQNYPTNMKERYESFMQKLE